MLRRCQFLLVSLTVCVASVLPSFAWSEESFVGKDKLEEFGYYESDPVVDRPMMMMAMSPYSVSFPSEMVSATVKFIDLVPSVPRNMAAGLYFDMRVTLPSGTISTPGARFVPEGGRSGLVSIGGLGQILYPFFSFSMPANSNYSNLRWLPVFYDGSELSSELLLTYDISSFDSSLFSFDGSFYPVMYIYESSSGAKYFRPDVLSLYVDGIKVREFSSSSGAFTFDGYVYSGSDVVESVSLGFSFQNAFSSIDFDTSYEQVLYIESSSDASLSFISAAGNGPPSGMVDADNTLGDYDTAEDQYFDDAESAVGGLDTSVPDGMLGSAAMIGGMFNDLWTVLGDFSLIYFIPLLFSFFLWIIGRKRGGSG